MKVRGQKWMGGERRRNSKLIVIYSSASHCLSNFIPGHCFHGKLEVAVNSIVILSNTNKSSSNRAVLWVLVCN